MIDDPLRIAGLVAAACLLASPYAAQVCKLAWEKIGTATSKKDLTQDIHTIVSIAARLKDAGQIEATAKARELIDLLLGGNKK